MLAKAFQQTRQALVKNNGSSLVSFTKRGVYSSGNEPHVFINKHTKVICQGMTGKHVSYSIFLFTYHILILILIFALIPI